MAHRSLLASRETAGGGSNTHPDGSRPRGTFPVPPSPATPASQPGAGPGSGHSGFPKRHQKSFGVRRRFLSEMKTRLPVSLEVWGILCLFFLLFFFFFWRELGGFSLGWHTGCELPHARVCAEHCGRGGYRGRGRRSLIPETFHLLLSLKLDLTGCRQLSSWPWEARICG